MGSDMTSLLNQMTILRKYNAFPSKQINSMTNSELSDFKKALKAAKLASTTKSDEMVIDLWISGVEAEEKLRSSGEQGMDVNTGDRRSILPGAFPTGGNNGDKWPAWKIAAVGLGGLTVAGLLIFAVYKVSKRNKN